MDLLEIARLNANVGFGKLIGMSFDSAALDRVTGHLDVTPELHQPFGVVNGGVLCALVETFGSVGGGLNVVHDGKSVVGVANATDFLRPVVDGRLDVVATAIHIGRTQHLWLVEITRADGKLAARGQVRLQVVELPEGV